MELAITAFKEIETKLKELFGRIAQLEAATNQGTGSGTAPSDAQYLVNAADADLSNEIVVTAVQGSIIYGNATPTWTTLGIGANNTFLASNGTVPGWRVLGVGDLPAHNLLSTTHGDTVVNAVTRGSLVYGNATPAWDELTHPGTNYHLQTDTNDLLWRQDLYLNNGYFVGNSGFSRLTFDSSGATDYAYFSACNVGIKTATPGATLTLYESGTPNPSFRIEDGDITIPSYAATGFNPALTTNTIAQWTSWSGSTGGVQLAGFTSVTNTGTPFAVVGYHGGTAPTTAAIQLIGYKHNGATNRTALGNSELILQISNGVAAPKITVLGSGYTGLGTAAPATLLELAETQLLTGNFSDRYAAALTLDPGYTGAFTIDRHNYIDVNRPSLASGATVTNAAVFRFDAAIGTHEALVAAFDTTDDNGDRTSWAGGIPVNVDGTLYKIPIIAV